MNETDFSAKLPSSDAHLIELGQGSYVFKVRPGTAIVRRANGLYVFNHTTWWAELEFPRGVIDSPPSGNGKYPVESRTRVRLPLVKDAQGPYDYTATLLTDRGPVEADGESQPKIIIEP